MRVSHLIHFHSLDQALTHDSPHYRFRTEVLPTDREHVRRLVAATGAFHPPEVDVAVELVDERLAKGAASGYEFLLLEDRDQKSASAPLGYACFGLIPCTVASYDLYWIAVDPTCQGRGLGKLLLQESELQAQARGGTQMYIDTSNRAEYAATRGFYTACGYELAALLPDFFAPGDDKAIYVKKIGPTNAAP